MSKFHVKDNGDPGVCTAALGNCPFGEEAPHFENKKDARSFYEASQTSSISSTKKNPNGYWAVDPFTGEKSTFNKNQLDFDKGTVEAFTEGDCWRLALDLHKKTDYPVFVITSSEYTLGDRSSMYFSHMLVKNPETGKFIDINGEQTESELLEAGWGNDCTDRVIVDVSDDLNINQAATPFYKKFDSSDFADEIIKRLDLKI